MYQNPYQMQFMPPYPYGQTLRNTYGNERDFYSQQMNAQQQQNMYAPQQAPMQMQSNIEYVNGIEGAKAFMLPPNAQKLLLDSDNPFFYIKTTDQQGKPVVKRFKYIDIDAEQQAQQAQYELEKARVENEKKIENAKADAEVMRQQNSQITEQTLRLKELENQLNNIFENNI